MFAWLPQCGCTLTCSAPKSSFARSMAELLDDVDVFTSAIPAAAGIALGVFVREHDPCASMTARLVKFSLAINSMFSN